MLGGFELYRGALGHHLLRAHGDGALDDGDLDLVVAVGPAAAVGGAGGVREVDHSWPHCSRLFASGLVPVGVGAGAGGAGVEERAGEVCLLLLLQLALVGIGVLVDDELLLGLVFKDVLGEGIRSRRDSIIHSWWEDRLCHRWHKLLDSFNKGHNMIN